MWYIGRCARKHNFGNVKKVKEQFEDLVNKQGKDGFLWDVLNKSKSYQREAATC